MVLSDVLSIIAIIVAIGSVVYQVIVSKRMNRLNLENRFYEIIFDKILLYDIPKARSYFVHVAGVLEATDKLQKAVVELRKKALFFKYKNLNFYTELCNMCMEIEDFLLNSEGEMTKSEFKKFESQIDKKLEDLYTLISNYSSG